MEKEKTMTDQEFEKLKRKIEKKMYQLSILQRRYKKEVGKEYVPPIDFDKPIWARHKIIRGR